MSDYIEDPIDVLVFDKRFRARSKVARNATLVHFKQSRTIWAATYQDDNQSMTFSGGVQTARDWMEEEEKKT